MYVAYGCQESPLLVVSLGWLLRILANASTRVCYWVLQYENPHIRRRASDVVIWFKRQLPYLRDGDVLTKFDFDRISCRIIRSSWTLICRILIWFSTFDAADQPYVMHSYTALSFSLCYKRGLYRWLLDRFPHFFNRWPTDRFCGFQEGHFETEWVQVQPRSPLILYL